MSKTLNFLKEALIFYGFSLVTQFMNAFELMIAFLRRLLPGVAGRAHPGVQARRRVHQWHHSRHRHRAAARH
jgi:hypothetical protein